MSTKHKTYAIPHLGFLLIHSWLNNSWWHSWTNWVYSTEWSRLRDLIYFRVILLTSLKNQCLQNRAELMNQNFAILVSIFATAMGAIGIYAHWDTGPSRKLKRGEFFCANCDVIIDAVDTRTEASGDKKVRVCVICGRSTKYWEPLLLYSVICMISGYFVFLYLKQFRRRSRLD